MNLCKSFLAVLAAAFAVAAGAQTLKMTPQVAGITTYEASTAVNLIVVKPEIPLPGLDPSVLTVNTNGTERNVISVYPSDARGAFNPEGEYLALGLDKAAGRRLGLTKGDGVWKEDYTHITLTDEEDIPDAVAKLRTIYHRLMKLDYETAELLYPGMPKRILPTMREMDFGRFEGRNHAELDGDPEYQAWIDSGGKNGFPGGEDRKSFSLRTMAAFREMLSLLPDEAEGQLRVALVCHGGNIMAIMSELTGNGFYDYLVKNGEGYELTFSLTGDTIHDLSYHSLYTGGTA